MAQHMDRIFSALSDPTRRAVVERLAAGPATVSELAAPHNLALSTFLRHLRVLEDAGLVRSVKRGRVRTCYISGAPLMAAQGWLAWQREVVETRAGDQAETLERGIARLQAATQQRG